MEALDRELAEVNLESAPTIGPAEVLIACADGPGRNQLVRAITQRRHRCACAASVDDARELATRTLFDIMLINPALPGGDWLDLAADVQRMSPSTKIILLHKSSDDLLHKPSDDRLLVEAMRRGVVDAVSFPIIDAELAPRLEAALLRSRSDQQLEERLFRLKRLCTKLNQARHEIAEQVDSLCRDLVNAYQDIAEQMNEVEMTAEFRTLLRLELDIEQLLRTALEYMLTKTGPTNAAVFLPDAARHFSLGAYVNYDCPRETISVLLDPLGQAVCPQMADETQIVAFDDAAEFAEWIGIDSGFLGESQVIAFSCMHKHECLAVIVLFRSRTEPFAETLASTIELLRPIFGEQVANVIRIHHRANASWPAESFDDEVDSNDETDLGFGGIAA